MRRLTGLQAKMTASYVVVTAAAVLLVEAAAIGLLVPSAVSASDLRTRVQSTVAALSASSSAAWLKLGAPPTGAGFPVNSAVAPASPGTVRADDSGGLVVDRSTGGYTPGQGAVALALMVGTDGRVIASSYPAQFPVGSSPRLPYDPTQQYKGVGSATSPDGALTWAAGPVTAERTPDKTPLPGKKGPSSAATGGPAPSPSASADASAGGGKAAVAEPQVRATVYVQVASDASVNGARDVNPSLRLSALVLALLLPVGAVFGFLSTRRTVRRVRSLEETTARVAAGDLAQRVAVSGRDELAGLESGFNSMAEQLQASLDAERQLSGAAARAAERTRIARELHDSVSQDLFSLGLLAGGLRKALPADSGLQPEVEAMERTSRRALREMQALLLELRPVAMEDVGLSAALSELCQAYRARLGIDVRAQIDPVDAAPAVEHGVLRVTQEALANAVRHGDPSSIWLSVQQADGTVRVRVHDDGVGFDVDPGPGRNGFGLGLRSMRERVAGLGGDLSVESAPGEGTTISVVVPAGLPSGGPS